MAATVPAPGLGAEKSFAMGMLATPAGEYVQYPKWTPPALVPRVDGGADAADLREFMPPPGDQGGQSSCVAWALAYAVQSYLAAVRRGDLPTTADRQFSPAFLYNQINDGRDRGSYIVEALATARAIGGATWSEMPYTDRDFERQPSRDQIIQARDHQIGGFARLETRDEIRDTLAARLPVLVGVETSPKFLGESAMWETYARADWFAATSTRDPNQPHGLHALVLVAFDDRRRAFLAQNSWGRDWGSDGYCWLDYDLFDRVDPKHAFLREAWVAFPRHGMAAHVQQALGGRSGGIQAGYLLDKSYRDESTDHSVGWEWELRLVDADRRLEDVGAVEWAWTDHGWPVSSTARNIGDGFAASGRFPGAGRLAVTGTIHFRDGGTATVRDEFLFIPDVVMSAIDVREFYWGRDRPDGPRRWAWIARIFVPDEFRPSLQRVEWELDEQYEHRRIESTDSGNFFELPVRGQKASVLRAVLHYTDGSTERLATALMPFSAIEDELRVNVIAGETRDDAGRLRHSVHLSLAGPLRDLERIDEVVYHLPPMFDRTTVAVDRRSGGHNFAFDYAGLAQPPDGFEAVAEVMFPDGTRREATGSYRPAGD